MSTLNNKASSISYRFVRKCFTGRNVFHGYKTHALASVNNKES